MSDNPRELADLVVKRLRLLRFRFRDERELQDTVAAAFEGWVYEGLPIAREYDLHPHGRVDFYFPHRFGAGVGMEIKVDGAPAGVVRQVHGYAQHAEIGELILVTSRIRLGSLIPETLNGKRVQVVSLWEGAL